MSVVDGRVVGSASIEMIPSNGVGSMIRPLRMAELGIGILDGYRGLGLGRRLIDELEIWAAEHGVERIVLLVADANEGAIRLYRRLGYVDESVVLRKDVAGHIADGEPMTTFDDVRRIALALPEAEERLTWETDITFRVRDKIFAIGGEGADRVSIKAGLETQAELIELDPATFAKSAYVGRFGWITVDLDRVDPDAADLAAP